METSEKLKKKVKRRFSEAWLQDEKLKSWVRKVTYDDSLFHCIICNKNFTCNSLSHLKRHAESAQHKKNVEEGPSSYNINNNIPKRKLFRKKIFRHQWLDIEQFKPWLREVPHDASSFFCKICDKIIAGGLSQIQRHANSNAHKNRIEKCDTQTNEQNKELKIQINEKYLLFEEQKRSAEIRFAALIADKNIPHETAKTILDFFKSVDRNPNVLKSMSMGRTKCTNIISNVLCPVEMNRLVKNLQNTKFSIFIDETLNISNENWMTFHVRYVNSETLQVQTQLVKLIDIDGTDHSTEKLYDTFAFELSKLEIPFSNIIALSSDNVTTMSDKHLYIKQKLEEMNPNVLTLSCPCHSTALAVHVACSKIPEICEEFLKKIATYIKSNPKRTIIFREFAECFQESSHIILKLPNTRWLSHYMYIKKLLESWDTIKGFLNEVVKSEKTKCVENLLCLMDNADIKAYLLFLRHNLYFFYIFNIFFQSVETRVHLLQPKSVDLLTDICRNFLKPEVLKNLPDVTFKSDENYKCINEVDLGTECEEYLCQLTEEGYANMVTNIRENCLNFYITLAEELCEKLPICDIFLSKLKIFVPQIALLCPDRKQSYNDLCYVAKVIGDYDANELKNEWFKLPSDFSPIDKQNLSKLKFDNMWIQIFQDQNSDEIKYPNLKSLLNIIRSLPNSNVNPERILFFLIETKTRKRNKLSSAAINATCVVRSALKARCETALDMAIDAEHLSLMSSETLYPSFSKKTSSDGIEIYVINEDNEMAGPSSCNEMQE